LLNPTKNIVFSVDGGVDVAYHLWRGATKHTRISTGKGSRLYNARTM
jgi:hypothetical protein